MTQLEHDVFLQQEISVFKERCGYTPNLDNPLTFCEKLMVKKIFNPRPDLSDYADKIKARGFIPDKYLIPAVIGDDDVLKNPPIPSVLKMNNASGRNIFLFKDEGESKKNYETIKRWLNAPYGKKNFEWDALYKHIVPGVLVETEILPIPHLVYRFNVFHGKVEFINVYDSFITYKLHYSTVTTYDRDWCFIPVKLKGLPIRLIKEPENLDEMIKLTEMLCAHFDYVRFDLYNIDGRIIFNEFTFYPLSCKIKIEPVKYDYLWGELL